MNGILHWQSRFACCLNAVRCCCWNILKSSRTKDLTLDSWYTLLINLFIYLLSDFNQRIESLKELVTLLEITNCSSIICSTGLTAVFTHASNPDMALGNQRKKRKIWAKKKKKMQIHGPHGTLIHLGLQHTCESGLTLTDRRLWA